MTIDADFEILPDLPFSSVAVTAPVALDDPDARTKPEDQDPADSWSPTTRTRVRVLMGRLADGELPAKLSLEYVPVWGISHTTFNKLVRLARQQLERNVGDNAPAQLRTRAVEVAERAIKVAFENPNKPRLDPALRAAELLGTIAKDIEMRKQGPVVLIQNVTDARAVFLQKLERLGAGSKGPALPAAEAEPVPVYDGEIDL